MALLTGKTEDGQEVPVQVKPDGKLVAEGLTGPTGPAGPEGPAGLQVGADGYARLPAGSKGIQFQGSTSATSALNFYEEGTFAPSVVGTSGAGACTYTNRVGRFTRIGNRVFYTIYLNWTDHTGTGKLTIHDLPFNAQATGGNVPSTTVASSGIASPANTVLSALKVNGNKVINLYYCPLSGGTLALLDMDPAGTLYLSGQYEVA